MTRTSRLAALLVLCVTALLAPAAAAQAAPPTSNRVNFQPASAPLLTGYAIDTGAGFDAARGYGWVRPGSSTAVDLAANTRLRSSPTTNERLRRLIHMQGTTALPVTGAWEYIVPNGGYTVTVSVGDGAATDSVHRLVVEGTVAVDGFVPTSTKRFATATVTVTVADGRLTLAAEGGANTKLNYADFAPAGTDTTAPGVTSTRPEQGTTGVALDANAEATFSEAINPATLTTSSFRIRRQGATIDISGVVSYDAGSRTARFDPINGFKASSTYTATLSSSVRDLAGNALAPFSWTFTSASGTSVSNAEIEVANLDGAPYADRLVFNRIQTPNPTKPNAVHDISVLRISNRGTADLSVSGLSLTGPFQLVNPPVAPFAVAPGASRDVTVRFVAQAIGTAGGYYEGRLTVRSNDSDEGALPVALVGFWQAESEKGQEPNLFEILRVFGYKTVIRAGGESTNTSGRLVAQGDEVLTGYFQRANTAQPVTIRQLGAFHTQGATATISTTDQATGTTAPARQSRLQHAGSDGQSFLPRRNDTARSQSFVAFTPTQTTFGFQIDRELSDWRFNSNLPDIENGCRVTATGVEDTNPCGHHLRTYLARDRAGNPIPDTYLLWMDYSGINYDFNDNVYLVTNLRPIAGVTDPVGGAARAALHRLDVAGQADYSDSRGQRWIPDDGTFSPASAPDEGTAATSVQTIGNTTDDVLYRTYRGNTSGLTTTRELSYALPVAGDTSVDLRLHLAERFWSANGERLFDVIAEGRTLRTGIDIHAAAGEPNRLVVQSFPDIAVADGTLNITLRATRNYVAVNAIEVLP